MPQSFPTQRPLCIDLDGTLVRDDTLWLSLMLALRQAPLLIPLFLTKLILLRQKAEAKELLARTVIPDATTLLYREPVLALISEARKAGRPVWLVTGADQRVANAIAGYLGFFDRILASDGKNNLRGERKAQKLQEETGDVGFDYAGNDNPDLPAWKKASHVIAVTESVPYSKKVRQSFPQSEIILIQQSSLLNTLPRLLRIKQWIKNLLLFVPLVTAHLWSSSLAWTHLAFAFATFCFGCSGVYIFNDLLDLEHDRKNPKKKFRPLARGNVSIPVALVIALLLFALCVPLLLHSNTDFVIVFGIYILLTFLYSFWLKHLLLVDICLLAAFYVLRIFAGALALEVPLSNWLLSFSAFVFLSLALLKRYGEVVLIKKHSGGKSVGRDYYGDDATVLCAMGIGCAIGAAIMLALFVDSSNASGAYRHPQFLWLACPAFLYWLCRLWILAERGAEVDDPITFAIMDRASYGVAVLLGLTFLFSL